MYKDKDKQREAQRQWVRQKRIDKKGSTAPPVQCGVMTNSIDSPERDEAIEFMSKTAGINERAKPECTAKGNIRVSKPGVDDYVPQCETTRAFVDNRDKRTSPTKRGKDIKCFADLPPDVQWKIDRMSTNDGKVDEAEKAKRTAVAIHYQHVFPDRYESTGVE